MTALVSAPQVADSPSVSSSLSAEQKNEIMSRALTLKGVSIPSLRFLDRALDQGQRLLSFTVPQVASLAGCGIRRAYDVRKWIERHNLLSCFDLSLTSEKNCSMQCCKKTSSKEEKKLNKLTPSTPLHDEENCNRPISTEALAKKLLDEIGFLTFPGPGGKRIPCSRRRSELIDARIDGRVNDVLYACWLASSPKRKIKNRGGFVAAFLEDGRSAPDGWEHPALKDRKALERKSLIPPLPPETNEIDQIEEAYVPMQKDYLILELDALEQRLELYDSNPQRLRAEILGKETLSDCNIEALNQYRSEVLKRLVETIDERPKEIFSYTPPELSEVYYWLRMRSQTQDDWWKFFVDSAMTYGADGSVIFWTADETMKAYIESQYGNLIREGLCKHQDTLWQNWKYWQAWTDERPAPRRKLRFEALVIK